MTITLTPEHEKFVRAAIRSGAYTDPGEVIGRALEVLSLEDERLLKHSHIIDEKISRGLAQLDRGEGIPSEDARMRLQERKATFLAQDSNPAR